MLFNKLTSNCSNKKFFIFLPVQRPPGGLELRNLEAYPKNLKSGGNSSYKNDFNNVYFFFWCCQVPPSLGDSTYNTLNCCYLSTI